MPGKKIPKLNAHWKRENAYLWRLAEARQREAIEKGYGHGLSTEVIEAQRIQNGIIAAQREMFRFTIQPPRQAPWWRRVWVWIKRRMG